MQAVRLHLGYKDKAEQLFIRPPLKEMRKISQEPRFETLGTLVKHYKNFYYFEMAMGRASLLPKIEDGQSDMKAIFGDIQSYTQKSRVDTKVLIAKNRNKNGRK